MVPEQRQMSQRTATEECTAIVWKLGDRTFAASTSRLEAIRRWRVDEEVQLAKKSIDTMFKKGCGAVSVYTLNDAVDLLYAYDLRCPSSASLWWMYLLHRCDQSDCRIDYTGSDIKDRNVVNKSHWVDYTTDYQCNRKKWPTLGIPEAGDDGIPECQEVRLRLKLAQVMHGSAVAPFTRLLAVVDYPDDPSLAVPTLWDCCIPAARRYLRHKNLILETLINEGKVPHVYEEIGRFDKCAELISETFG